MAQYSPEAAFNQYKVLRRGIGFWANGNGANTYLIYPNGAVANTGSNAAFAMFYLDPADFPCGNRTVYCRLRYSAATNATASTISFTFGLYPVASVAGGANVVSATVGTVVSGSQPSALATPAASTAFEGHSADFAMPAAGQYTLGCVLSGTMAANSALVAPVVLERREV